MLSTTAATEPNISRPGTAARATVGLLGRMVVAHRRPASTLLWLALGGVAAYILLPQSGVLRESLTPLASADPAWLAAALILVGLRYVMTVGSMQAALDRPIPFGPTLLVQVSASFLGRLTPEGIGWLVLNQRYLERIGLPRSSAAAAIGLKVIAGTLARLAVMAVVAALASASGMVKIRVEWLTALAAVVAVVGTAGLVWIGLSRRAPDRLVPVARAVADMAHILRQPRRAGALLVTSAIVTLSYPLALVASALAVGVEAGPLEITAIYLAATALAAASPTPGNIGAVEVALSAGLTGLGVASAPAVAAVLVFRLLTFWLPIVPGFAAFRYLQRTNRL